MDRRWALVTGANKGLGLETARQLGASGLRVLLGARQEAAGMAAAGALRKQGVEAHWVALDVCDDASVQQAVRRVQDLAGGLDVLVNNAGIYLRSAGSPLEQPVADIRRTFETNFLGTVRVTQAFLPLLRRGRSPRIVNVSSGLGSIAQQADRHFPFDRFKSLSYAPSKSAINAATVTFARLLESDGIKVNAADPGRCATDLNGHQGDRSAEQGARIVVRLATLPDDGPTGGFFDENGRVPW